MLKAILWIWTEQELKSIVWCEMQLPEVYSETAMLSRALQTNPDAVSDTGPLRVWSSTLEAELYEESNSM